MVVNDDDGNASGKTGKARKKRKKSKNSSNANGENADGDDDAVVQPAEGEVVSAQQQQQAEPDKYEWKTLPITLKYDHLS